MHGRRLVDAPGNRLKIGDVEDPGIFVTVPADDVERVIVVPVASDAVADLEAHLELALLRVRDQFFRAANVAVAVGRVFEELPVVVEVAAWRLDSAMRLNGQEARLRAIGRDIEAE